MDKKDIQRKIEVLEYINILDPNRRIQRAIKEYEELILEGDGA